MKRAPRKMMILIAILVLAGIGWHFGLDRAADCWTQGGRWAWDGGFCRLDTLPQRAPD